MSWFVLHPPPGIMVVSFFITARYKGQDDRTAFIDAVTEQLTILLRRPVPEYLAEAAREHHLLALLAEAAGTGRGLVLVVDGLDEDRAVTAGPDIYSIAALLPARPPPGLRVIVAGRSDPSVPDDVPNDHPLRDPGIVRTLVPSPAAVVVRSDMQRELRRLLHGDQAQQDLLGLVTAAGGGLAARDLADLTGIEAREIEESLRTVAGRSFPVAPGTGSPARRRQFTYWATRNSRQPPPPLWGQAAWSGIGNGCMTGHRSTRRRAGQPEHRNICCAATSACCWTPPI